MSQYIDLESQVINPTAGSRESSVDNVKDDEPEQKKAKRTRKNNPRNTKSKSVSSNASDKVETAHSSIEETDSVVAKASVKEPSGFEFSYDSTDNVNSQIRRKRKIGFDKQTKGNLFNFDFNICVVSPKDGVGFLNNSFVLYKFWYTKAQPDVMQIGNKFEISDWKYVINLVAALKAFDPKLFEKADKVQPKANH